MEHARKMILIPQENIDRLRDLKSVQTPGTVASRLDLEMSEILNSSTNERQKCTLYQQALQRYLHFKGIEGNIADVKEGEEEGAIVNNNDNKNNNINNNNQEKDFIIDSVPAKYRKNAENLLKKLNQTGIIVWDRYGSVKINGVTIPRANIVDLVNYALRDRKIQPPTGHSQFVRALRDVCMPREFIGNDRVWKGINISPSSTSDFHSPEANRAIEAVESNLNRSFFKRNNFSFSSPVSSTSSSSSSSSRIVSPPDENIIVKNKKNKNKIKKKPTKKTLLTWNRLSQQKKKEEEPENGSDKKKKIVEKPIVC